MPVRAVLFDVGGVILRTEDPEPRRRWERRLGLAPGRLVEAVFDNPEALRATRGEAREEDVWREVGRSLDLTAEQLARFRVDFFAGDRWDEELLAFIRSLRPSVRTGVISNGWLGAQAAMEKWINPGTFDVIVFSGLEKCAKPDERIFRLALGRLGLTPEETMFFDDSRTNVEGAARIGMRAVLFEGPRPAMELVRKTLNLPSPS
jgi:epoxide hydrolase-like predicted phosphatase